MSASLVGSEMCIRDSVAGVPKQLQIWVRVRKRRFYDEVEGSERSEVQTCLLYTSDAADDM
eukprot:13194854-Alexandrium_andersonii.AAC.1